MRKEKFSVSLNRLLGTENVRTLGAALTYFLSLYLFSTFVSRFFEFNKTELLATFSLFISLHILVKTENAFQGKFLKTATTSLLKISDGHWSCQLGDLKLEAGGWFVYPSFGSHRGARMGPYQDLESASFTLLNVTTKI